MGSESLKPCPFCGSTNLEQSANEVACDDCGGAVILGWSPSITGEQVAAAWNRRASSQGGDHDPSK